MSDFPKCTKAEMLPGVRLRCKFENGEVRYYPVREQIDLLMRPADLEVARKHYGANLFLGNMMTWIGNDITIEENGDVLLNKLVIPAELLWKYSLEHLNSVDQEQLEELEQIKHPILEGFKNLSLLLWIFGGLIVLALLL